MPAAIPIESHSAKHDGRECIVSLFSTEIVLEFSNSTIEPIILAEKDLFCVTELPGSGLVLHSFPFVQSGMLWWKKSARTRQDLMIELNNIHGLSSFVTKIRCMILGKPISDQPLKPPRYYVIINPAGGTGVANTIYEQIVRPIFMLVQAELVEFISDRRGSVPQELKTAQLTGFDAIVTISGDGTIHEVLNGLMSRPDWKEIVQIPLGCVPGGSGNALAHTTGLKTPLDAALSIVKGKTQPLDVCSIVQSNRRFFSFLTISWAIASDVDIESEVLRWMGDLRFTLWAVYRMIFLRRYHGKLEFISKDTQNYQASGSDVEEGLSAQTPAAGDYWPSLKYIGPYAYVLFVTVTCSTHTFSLSLSLSLSLSVLLLSLISDGTIRLIHFLADNPLHGQPCKIGTLFSWLRT
eukprot:TRINITY_DN4367_c0_g1_i2.p1 TRINITY_DN4367_c0_g1~~TRINITY_DN4367_c0_g1_i2.p1  ORF type:complete len:408 (+),score=56.90 TRINITY_DN4367_c0_g1_i2:51-1274(+)